MYCIECGAKIPDNSKFCSHCGKLQNESEPSVKEKVTEKIIENETVQEVVEEHKRSLDYQFLKKAMGWYLAWVILNLAFLLIGSDGIFTRGSYTDDFWPFGDYEIGEYDIREFLVYTIFPMATLIIWSMVRSQNQDQNA